MPCIFREKTAADFQQLTKAVKNWHSICIRKLHKTTKTPRHYDKTIRNTPKAESVPRSYHSCKKRSLQEIQT